MANRYLVQHGVSNTTRLGIRSCLCTKKGIPSFCTVYTWCSLARQRLPATTSPTANQDSQKQVSMQGIIPLPQFSLPFTTPYTVPSRVQQPLFRPHQSRTNAPSKNKPPTAQQQFNRRTPWPSHEPPPPQPQTTSHSHSPC